MLTLEKKTLTLADIDAQTALELPSRETLALVTVVITNVLNNLHIEIPVRNNNVGLQICAVVNAITANNMATLTCTVNQTQ